MPSSLARDHLYVSCVICPQELTAAKAYEILRRMTDEDCKALGFNTKYVRPDWMILTVLPVPPPQVRPSVMMDSSARYVFWGHAHTHTHTHTHQERASERARESAYMQT